MSIFTAEYLIEVEIMLKYCIRRLLWMIPVVLGVGLLTFTLMYFVPGDPTSKLLGVDATPEERQALRDEMGLNDPYLVQLGRFFKETFIEFDLGKSYTTKQSVSQQIREKLPNTMRVCYFSVVISVLVGIPLGVLAATNQYSWKDNLSILLSLFFASMPGFWFALMLVMLLSVKWGILPTIYDGTWKSFIIPCISVGLAGAAGIARQTRSSMLEVIRQDYITTARAKGQTELKVIYQHALKNALIPVITAIGSQLAALVGSSIIAETIFSIPGIGTYMLNAVNARDYPVVQGTIIVVAIIFSMTIFIVDLLYAAVDPRLRSQY